jgi:P pilus assembly chaperone PapD
VTGKWISGVLAVAVFAAGLIASNAPAHADMVLNKVVIDFPGNKVPRDDIKIQNTGDETLFVLVEPFQILNPGTAQQKRERIRDPGKSGLLVTPNRFVLQGKQTKVMRLVVLRPAEKKDRVYRLTVRPVIGKVEAAQTAVKIVIGYDVLVVVRPPGSKGNLEAKRDGKKIVFTNTGQTSVLLSNGKNCDAQEKECVDLPPKRMYVGTEWTLNLTHDTPANYYVTVREEILQKSF